MLILICKTLSIIHENIYPFMPTDNDISGCSVSFIVKSPQHLFMMWCKMFDTIMPDYCLGERSFGHCKFTNMYRFKGQLCLHLLVEGRYNSSTGPINEITHFIGPQQIIHIKYPVSVPAVPVLLKLWKPSLTELCQFRQFRHHYSNREI